MWLWWATAPPSQDDSVAAVDLRDSNVTVSPSAPSSMFLITANIRASFAFIILSSTPLSLVPQSFSSPFSLVVTHCPPPTHPPTVSLPLSPGVSLSSPHKEQRQRIRASTDVTCRRQSWGHALLTGEGKAPLLPLMRPLTAVSNTLCVGVEGARTHRKVMKRKTREKCKPWVGVYAVSRLRSWRVDLHDTKTYIMLQLLGYVWSHESRNCGAQYLQAIYEVYRLHCWGFFFFCYLMSNANYGSLIISGCDTQLWYTHV